MVFGSILSKCKYPVTLVTADDKKVEVDSFIKKLGVKIFGIPHEGLRIRARKILKNYVPRKGDRILDAGCGIGLYSLIYAKKYPAFVEGVDLSEDKIKEAQKIKDSLDIKNLNFSKGDISKLNFDKESFDFILCSDVLEHIEKDFLVVNELNRVLKKRGKIIFTFPYFSKHNFQVMKKFGHVRAGYNRQLITNLLETVGLKVAKIEGYTYFFGKISWAINEKTFFSPVLASILFYPLYLFSFLDFLRIGKPGGILVVAKK